MGDSTFEPEAERWSDERIAQRQAEYQQIREAYTRQPDSAEDADDWSSADEWKLDD